MIRASLGKAMNSESDFPEEEDAALYDKFREIKHSINNSLAVIMALSELAQRNPAHFEKLAQTVLIRCPQIVSQLQDFQKDLPKIRVAEAGQAA
jgi:two-component sensor histidine kinase